MTGFLRQFLSPVAALAAALAVAGAAAQEISPAHSGGPAMTVLASASGPVALGPAPVRVMLAVAPAKRDALRQAARDGKAVLRLSGLAARAQPGVTWRVYLGLAEGAVPDEDHAAGTINFFNVVALPGGRPKPDQPLDFKVAAPIAATAPAGGIAVTFVPDGTPDPGSGASIGRMEIGQI